MEALDEARGDDAFETAAAKLLDEFKAVTPRLVVMTPPEFDHHPWPAPAKGLPDKTSKNERVLRLGGILKRLAAARGAIVLDVPALERERKPGQSVERTANGVHLTKEAIRDIYSPMLTAGLSLAVEPVPAESPLLSVIQEKNHNWHDCWKAMNWAFAYSDRTEQPFGKSAGDHPPLAKELEQYKPLLREADERIQTLASGGTRSRRLRSGCRCSPRPSLRRRRKNRLKSATGLP